MLVEELDYLFAIGVIEGGGGFVGEDDFGLIDEGSSDADSLAFAAGEFVGEAVQFVFETEFGEEVFGAIFRGWRDGEDILKRGEVTEEEGLLEDKSEALEA